MYKLTPSSNWCVQYYHHLKRKMGLPFHLMAMRLENASKQNKQLFFRKQRFFVVRDYKFFYSHKLVRYIVQQKSISLYGVQEQCVFFIWALVIWGVNFWFFFAFFRKWQMSKTPTCDFLESSWTSFVSICCLFEIL